MLRASIRVKENNLDAIEMRVTKNARKATRELALEIVNDMKASWSPVSPSEWGMPPARVTGTLENSISVETQTRDSGGRFAGKSGSTSVIRIDANYAGVLESDYLNRPFFEPALERAAEKFDVAYRWIFR